MRSRWRIKTLMIGIAIAGLVFGILGSVRVTVHRFVGGEAMAIGIDPVPMAIAILSLIVLIVIRSRRRRRSDNDGPDRLDLTAGPAPGYDPREGAR